jgi:septal ring factor EnvC (AmiA/AmiB activator)
LLLIAVATPARADPQSPTQRLRTLEREIRSMREQDQHLAREGDARSREIAELRGQAIAAAALAQELEARIAEHRATIATLQQRLAQLTERVAARRVAAGRAVAALARLARVPPELVAFAPEAPADTLRGARLAGALVPVLADELRSLTAAMAETGNLAEAARVEQAALDAHEAERTAERDRLAALLRRRLELDATAADSRAVAANAIAERVRNAADLREMLARTSATPSPRAAADRRAAEQATRDAMAAAQRAFAARGALGDPLRPDQARAGQPLASLLPEPMLNGGAAFSTARGHILPPVRGRIVAAFGQPGADGQANRGIVFETVPDAQVVAPFAGQVMFAGAFRSYGLVLIIDHGEGYHSVILGLVRIDATAGQWVAAGEPVGAAPDVNGAANGAANVAGRPGIYLELRRAGQPIDPAGWLAASNRGESG